MKPNKIEHWQQKHNIRIYIEELICVCLLVILIFRLYVLQIINGTFYEKSTVLQSRKERTIKSTRGNIYDRIFLISSNFKNSPCNLFFEPTISETQVREFFRKDLSAKFIMVLPYSI